MPNKVIQSRWSICMCLRLSSNKVSGLWQYQNMAWEYSATTKVGSASWWMCQYSEQYHLYIRTLDKWVRNNSSPSSGGISQWQSINLASKSLGVNPQYAQSLNITLVFTWTSDEGKSLIAPVMPSYSKFLDWASHMFHYTHITHVLAIYHLYHNGLESDNNAIFANFKQSPFLYPITKCYQFFYNIS